MEDVLEGFGIRNYQPILLKLNLVTIEYRNVYKSYTHTSSNSPSSSIFTHPFELRFAGFLLIKVLRLITCKLFKSVRWPSASQLWVIETVPNQNDVDSGPRKSLKVDILRRARRIRIPGISERHKRDRKVYDHMSVEE